MKLISHSAAILAACFMLSPASATPNNSTPATMIVLDASGSMWGRLQGRSKIEIARSVLASSADKLSANAAVGMVAYGHRRQKDCSDIQTVLPLGYHKQSLAPVARGLQPKGRTPLTEAVRVAAGQVQQYGRKSTVILISDGLETCGGDPCQLARDLNASGLDFTAHVIGFNFETAANRGAISCLAEETGGKFLEANNEQELSAALDTVLQDATTENVIFTPAISAEPVAPPVRSYRPAPDPLYDSRGKNDGAIIYDPRPRTWSHE